MSRIFSILFLLVLFGAPMDRASAQEAEDVEILFKRIFNDVESRDRATRAVGVNALDQAAQRFQDAVWKLRRLLKDPDEAIRSQSAHALASIGPSAWRATGELAEALLDGSENVRIEAAMALFYVGPAAKKGVPALTRALRDESAKVRRAAAEALGAIGPEARSAVPALIKCLKDPDRDMNPSSATVRTIAARALGFIGSDAAPAVPALLEALKEGEPALQEMAVLALGRTGGQDDRVISVLVKILEDKDSGELRAGAALALGEIGAPRASVAVEAMLRVLNSELPKDKRQAEFIKSAVLEGLSRMGKDAKIAVPAITKIFLNRAESHSGRLAAGRALLALAPVAPETAAAFLETIKDSKANLDLQRLSFSGLSALREKGIGLLLDILAHPPGRNDRVFAIQALGSMGPAAKHAIPALEAALTDEDAAVCSASSRALRMIRE